MGSNWFILGEYLRDQMGLFLVSTYGIKWVYSSRVLTGSHGFILGEYLRDQMGLFLVSTYGIKWVYSS